MALIGTRPVVDAVLSRLSGLTTVTTYLGQGPRPPAARTCVLYPRPGAPDGVLGDPDRNSRLEFQTTCIGQTAEQALWTHDTVVARLNRQVLTGTGFSTYPLRMVAGTQQPVRRDDTLADPWYLVTCSWQATAQPT
jgi:hypothetical protein